MIVRLNACIFIICYLFPSYIFIFRRESYLESLSWSINRFIWWVKDLQNFYFGCLVHGISHLFWFEWYASVCIWEAIAFFSLLILVNFSWNLCTCVQYAPFLGMIKFRGTIICLFIFRKFSCKNFIVWLSISMEEVPNLKLHAKLHVHADG